ncbi:MAG: 3'(2'),5'-bisphosphate nucleotidase CysQ [Spirochaetaceae bacterium]
MTRADAHSYPATALRAALPAADAIMRIYEEGGWDVEEKADTSPLTRADREAHEVIVEVLEREAPEVPILSEEGAHLPFATRTGWKRLWVVDPLDGTKEFLSRNGEFTVNIALVEDGVPVLGVVAVPALDTWYVAAVGSGAFRVSRDELDEAVATADPLGSLSAGAARLEAGRAHGAGAPGVAGAGVAGAGEGGEVARVVASRSHLNAETEAFVEKLRARHGEVELVQAGSAVKLCRVAEGAADYYPRLAPTMEWDTAAGDAVVREAGGRVVQARADGTSDGAPLAYNKEDLHNPCFVAVGKGTML